MNTNNNTVNSSTTSAAGADPQPAAVTPARVIEQLRAVRSTLGDLSTITTADRKRLERRVRVSGDVLQAQINMIGVSDEVSAAVGTPADAAQELADTSAGWNAVEDELRVLLAAVESHNLVKYHELRELTSRATNIGAQLARDPKHASVLGTHLREIRRLKRLGRRRKVQAQKPESAASTDAEAAQGVN